MPETTSFSRRSFLATTGSAVTGLLAASPEVEARASSRLPALAVGPLIDVNLSLSHWPLRRLPADEPAALQQKLHDCGIIQGWAGSLDGLLHKDLASVNARLADACHRPPFRKTLLPFGSVNPIASDWEEELRRCVEVHHMPGIRLHPNYHGYRLDHPACGRLLRAATTRRLIVQLALIMEDERMMHPLLRIDPVDPAPLVPLIQQTPGLRLILLNAFRTMRAETLKKVLAAGEVYVEISMLEGAGGVEHLLTQLPPERVLFGSHAPLFYAESAVLKLKESSLSADQLHAVGLKNARRLI